MVEINPIPGGGGVPGPRPADSNTGGGAVENNQGPQGAGGVTETPFDRLTISEQEDRLIDRLVRMAEEGHKWLLFIAANGGLTPEDVRQMLEDFEALANDPNLSQTERDNARLIADRLKKVLENPELGGAQYLIFILSDPKKYLSDISQMAKEQYEANAEQRRQELLRIFNEQMGGGGEITTLPSYYNGQVIVGSGDDSIYVKKDGKYYVVISDGKGGVEIHEMKRVERVVTDSEGNQSTTYDWEMESEGTEIETGNRILWSQDTITGQIRSSDLRSAGLPTDYDLNNVPQSIQDIMKRYQGRTLMTTQQSTTTGGGYYYVLNTERLQYLQNEMMNKLTSVVMVAGLLQQVKDMFFDLWIALIDPSVKKPSSSFADVAGRLMKTWMKMFNDMVSKAKNWRERFNEATYNRKLKKAEEDAQDEAEDGAWGWLRQVGDFFGGDYVARAKDEYYYREKVKIDQERMQIARNEANAIRGVMFNVSRDIRVLTDPVSQREADQIDSLLDGEIGEAGSSSMIENRGQGNRNEGTSLAGGRTAVSVTGWLFTAGMGGQFLGLALDDVDISHVPDYIGVDEDRAIAVMDAMKNLTFAADFTRYIEVKAKEMFSEIMRALLEMPKLRSNLEKTQELMKIRQNIIAEWVSSYIEGLNNYAKAFNEWVNSQIEYEKAKARNQMAGWALFFGVFLCGAIIFSGLWYKMMMGAIEQDLADLNNNYKEGGLEIDPAKIGRRREDEQDVELNEEQRLERLEGELQYLLGRMNANYNSSLMTTLENDFRGVNQQQMVELNLMLDHVTMALNLIAQLRETRDKLTHKVWADIFGLEGGAIIRDGQLTEYMQAHGDLAKMKAGIQMQSTNEKVQEYNKQRAEQIAAEQAAKAVLTAFMDFIGAVLSIVGAILVCTPFAAIGVALVVIGVLIAVASAALKYAWAKENYNSAKDVEIKSSEDIVRVDSKKSQSEQVETAENDRIAQMYERMYMQMIMRINSMNVWNTSKGAGNDMLALDVGSIVQTGKLLSHLVMAQSILINLEAARDKMRNTIWENLFDLSPGTKTSSDITKAIVMRNFSTVMDILKSRLGQISTEIEALNRKEMAAQQLDAAETALIVACVTAPIKIVAAAVGGIAGAIISAATTVVEAIINIAIAVDNANTSLGEIEKIREKAMQAIDAAFKSEEKDPMMEYIKDAIKQINAGLIKSTSGGRVSYNKSEVIKAKHTIEKVFERRQMIQEIREAAMRIAQQVFEASNGMASVKTDMSMVSMSDQALKQFALNTLDNMEKSVKAQVERMNQINEAEKQMYMTIVTSAVSIAASAASVVGAASFPQGSQALQTFTQTVAWSSIVAQMLAESITLAAYNSSAKVYEGKDTTISSSRNASAIDAESQAMAAEVGDANDEERLDAMKDAYAAKREWGQIFANTFKAALIQLIKDLCATKIVDNTKAIQSNESQKKQLQAEIEILKKAEDAASQQKLAEFEQQAAKLEQQIKDLKAEMEKAKGERKDQLADQIEILEKDLVQLNAIKTTLQQIKDIKAEITRLQGERSQLESQLKTIQDTQRKLQEYQRALQSGNTALASQLQGELTPMLKAIQPNMPSNTPTLDYSQPTATQLSVIAEINNLMNAQQNPNVQGSLASKIEIVKGKRDVEQGKLDKAEATLTTQTGELDTTITAREGMSRKLSIDIMQRIELIKAGDYKELQEQDKQLAEIILQAKEGEIAQKTDAFFKSLPEAFRNDKEIMAHFASKVKETVDLVRAGKLDMTSQRAAEIAIYIATQGKPGSVLHKNEKERREIMESLLALNTEKLEKGEMGFAMSFMGAISQDQFSQVAGDFSKALQAQRSSFETLMMEMIIAQKQNPDIPQKINSVELMALYQESKAVLRALSTEKASVAMPKYAALLKRIAETPAFKEAFIAQAGKDGEAKYKQLLLQIDQLSTWSADKPPTSDQVDNLFDTLNQINNVVVGQLKGSTDPSLQALRALLINTEATGYAAVINYSDNQKAIDKAADSLIALNDMGTNEVSKMLQNIAIHNKGLFNKIMNALIARDTAGTAVRDMLLGMKKDIPVQFLIDLFKSEKKGDKEKCLEYIRGILARGEKATSIQKEAIKQLVASFLERLEVDLEKLSDIERQGGSKETIYDVLSQPQNEDIAVAVVTSMVDNDNPEKAIKVLMSLNSDAVQRVFSRISGTHSLSLMKEIMDNEKDVQKLMAIFKDNPKGLSSILYSIQKVDPKIVEGMLGKIMEQDKTPGKEFSVKVVTGMGTFPEAVRKELLSGVDLGKVTAAEIQKMEPAKAMMVLSALSSTDEGKERLAKDILPNIDSGTYARLFNEDPGVFNYFFNDSCDSKMREIITNKIINKDTNIDTIIGMYKKAEMPLVMMICHATPASQKHVVEGIFKKDPEMGVKIYQQMDALFQMGMKGPAIEILKTIPGLEEKAKVVAKPRTDDKVPETRIETAARPAADTALSSPFDQRSYQSELFRSLFNGASPINSIEQLKASPSFMRFITEVSKEGSFDISGPNPSDPPDVKEKKLQYQDMAKFLASLDSSQLDEFSKSISIPVIIYAGAASYISSDPSRLEMHKDRFQKLNGLADKVQGSVPDLGVVVPVGRK